jgi:hypothetical protein
MSEKMILFITTAVKSSNPTEVIQNHENANVRNIGTREARHRKYKRLKLGGGQAVVT